jgi:hypothetical protein
VGAAHSTLHDEPVCTPAWRVALGHFRCDASIAPASFSTMNERWAELVLVSSEGVLLGKLPPVLTERP